MYTVLKIYLYKVSIHYQISFLTSRAIIEIPLLSYQHSQGTEGNDRSPLMNDKSPFML